MDSMSPASLVSLSSLLTPAESYAFHSFLSAASPDDWINADDKQALTKATKDLLSLDSQFAVHSESLFSHISAPSSSSSHYQATLPHHPRSDSSSRTPTPTSAPPFPSRQPASGRHSSRTRPSHPHPYPQPPIPKQRRPSSASLPKPPQKPPLLSASQKKANHIQSEQKRRANIRRGYEALCDCVPALREAIQEEDALAASNDGGKTAVATGRRKSKTAMKGKDGEEKLDGRAGPRSENIVLSKTIDYITTLLDERRSLLARLHQARSSLTPGHPALVPLTPSDLGQGHERDGAVEDNGPLWEREWKGGHGTLGDTCDGDGDGDESS